MAQTGETAASAARRSGDRRRSRSSRWTISALRLLPDRAAASASRRRTSSGMRRRKRYRSPATARGTIQRPIPTNPRCLHARYQVVATGFQRDISGSLRLRADTRRQLEGRPAAVVTDGRNRKPGASAGIDAGKRHGESTPRARGRAAHESFAADGGHDDALSRLEAGPPNGHRITGEKVEDRRRVRSSCRTRAGIRSAAGNRRS